MNTEFNEKEGVYENAQPTEEKESADTTRLPGAETEKDFSDLKTCFSVNLVRYRKAANLTQAELAEKINYSDKAVSKWERAEAIPDVYTLKSIADYFGVTVDLLISPPKKEKPAFNMRLTKKRAIICLASLAIVWLVAVAFFAFIDIIFTELKPTWLSFIYAIPISCIVLLIFTAVWGKTLGNAVIISVLIWTTILTVYLTLIQVLTYVPPQLWEIFLVGIPAQGTTVFWYLYKRVNKG